MTRCIVMWYTYFVPEIKLHTDNLLNFSEASRLLQFTRVTIYAMIKKGQLNPVAIADRRYLLKEEVERLKTARAPVSQGALNDQGGEH